MTPTVPASPRRSASLSSGADNIFKNIVIGLSSIVLIATVLYGFVLIVGGFPALQKDAIGFLFGLNWDPAQNIYQAFPFIAGTFFTALGALVIAVPLSVAAALFISEYAPRWLAGPVGTMIELLAAIPSVVYGLWGIFVLIPAVRVFQVWVVNTANSLWVLSDNPIIRGFQEWLVDAMNLPWSPSGTGLMSAVLILAVMIVPFICAIARDVITLVPNDQREAAYALGATKWEVIRFGILPFARAGILGGVILGLGRALGETLAVTMVIGNANRIARDPFDSTATMSSIIASNFGEANDEMRPALIAIGFMLLIFSVIVNVIARVVITKLTPVGTR